MSEIWMRCHKCSHMETMPFELAQNWKCKICEEEMSRNECDDCGKHIVECECSESSDELAINPTRLRDQCDKVVALLQCLLLIDFKEGACYRDRPYEILILHVIEMLEEIENGIKKLR